jgi:hypothetical protein
VVSDSQGRPYYRRHWERQPGAKPTANASCSWPSFHSHPSAEVKRKRPTTGTLSGGSILSKLATQGHARYCSIRWPAAVLPAGATSIRWAGASFEHARRLFRTDSASNPGLDSYGSKTNVTGHLVSDMTTYPSARDARTAATTGPSGYTQWRMLDETARLIAASREAIECSRALLAKFDDDDRKRLNRLVEPILPDQSTTALG